MIRRISAAALLLAVTAAGSTVWAAQRTQAFAGVAPEYYAGSQSAGVVAGAQGAVRVAGETLTFRIGTLPQVREDEVLSPGTIEMQAEYVLVNDSDEDVSVRLFFPVGTRPDYADLPEVSQCSVTADGVPVATTPRYTYCADDMNAIYTETYDVLDAVPRDGYDESRFARDTKVYIYRYRVETPEEETPVSYDFLFSYDSNSRNTQVVNLSGPNGYISYGRGYRTCPVVAGEQKEVTIVAFGDAPANIRTEVRRDTSHDSPPVSGAVIAAEQVREMTFAEWAASMYPAVSAEIPVSETDWYNIVAEIMADGSNYLRYLPVGQTTVFELTGALRCWGEYEIAVPAGGTCVNAVSAPVYPTVTGGNGTSLTWQFTYDFSSDRCWTQFGDMTIRIETDYAIGQSSLALTEEDGAYVFTMDRLPMGDLSFVISQQSGPSPIFSPYGDPFPTVTAALIILGVVAGAAVVTLVVMLVRRKEAKKKLEAQQQRLEGIHAQSGRVEIGDPQDRDKQ